jgi:hypothetical protein
MDVGVAAAFPLLFDAKTNPQLLAGGLRVKDPGDDLLSHGLSHTTIGAAAFHFRVRDGIGWFHSANFTRETVGASPVLAFLEASHLEVRAFEEKRIRRSVSHRVLQRSEALEIFRRYRRVQGNLRLYGQATRIISIS